MQKIRGGTGKLVVRPTDSIVENREDVTTSRLCSIVIGSKHNLTHYIRKMPNIKHHLTELDAFVDNVFIPAITDGHGHICTADERRLLSLLVKRGGLGISTFSAIADHEFVNSRMATEQLVEHINNQYSTTPMGIERRMTSRRKIVNTREERFNSMLEQLCERQW